MIANPMIRPAVVSAALIVTSVVIGPCLIYAGAATVVNWPAPMWLVITMAILLAVALIVLFTWTKRLRRSHQWDLDAQLQWQKLRAVKANSGTTTEVTVLSIDQVQPTGAWATIKWNRFGYVQPAWLESGPFEYRSHSVLLIRPDPDQVHIGQPWPSTYSIRPNACHAIAPVMPQPREAPGKNTESQWVRTLL